MTHLHPLVIGILVWAAVFAMLIAFFAGAGHTRGSDE
jgi:hypothetical protein